MSGAGLSGLTTDSTTFSFDFAPPTEANAVTFGFMFGTEEDFLNDPLSDIAAVFVDGVNVLTFADGSVVSAASTDQLFANPQNIDTGESALDIEYDFISAPRQIVAFVDPTLTTHTLKFAVSDTGDSVFDSALFIGGIAAANVSVGAVLSIDSVSVNEDAGNAVFSVSRSGDLSAPASVSFATADGTATGAATTWRKAAR